MLCCPPLAGGGTPLPCTCKPAKGARREAVSPRPSSSGRGTSGDPLPPGVDAGRAGGSWPTADAERGTPMGAPMGRKGCGRGAGADRGAEWGPRLVVLRRGTRCCPRLFGAAAAATLAAAAAAEAAEAATVAGAKARGSNDMTESGLRRDSSVRRGLSSSRSMMRVAARPVKPSSGSVCTNRPADVRVARQQVQSRSVCASSQLHARGVQCALGRERTAQDGGALLLEQRAVVDRDEARDALPLLILVPEPDPGADLAGPHPFSVGRLTSIRCGANALDAHGVELRVHVLSQILVEPPVGGEAHLGIGLLRDPDQLLHFLGLELAVLVAADNAVDVEKEDAQLRGCHRWLACWLRRSCFVGGGHPRPLAHDVRGVCMLCHGPIAAGTVEMTSDDYE